MGYFLVFEVLQITQPKDLPAFFGQLVDGLLYLIVQILALQLMLGRVSHLVHQEKALLVNLVD